MGATDGRKQVFLVEECSKAHVERIRELMKDDYAWASIAMIALLSSDADLIGSWAEACPCHPVDTRSGGRSQLDRTNREAMKEAKACPFRSCRAPELATGQGIQLLCDRMASHHGPFMDYVQRAPISKRSELASSWRSASAKLFGLFDICDLCDDFIFPY